jgi:putative chitinase
VKLDTVQFATLFPKVHAHLRERYRGAINVACDEFDILSSRRLAAFVAQVGHETGGLQFLEELGAPPYFAKYDGRLDLGNVNPGDGARYHGRGLIQLTGRQNYAEFGKALGLPLELQPELALEVEVGARIAARFWETRGCNVLADHNDFELITRRINGGLNGLDDRKQRWKEAKYLLGVPEGGIHA